MMKTNHSSLCAGAAIAAALALVPTTALAQGIEAPTMAPSPPVMVFPETIAPPAPQPTIVIPPQLPTMTQPVETVRAPEAAPATPVTTQARAAPRPAAAQAARTEMQAPAPGTGAERDAPAPAEESTVSAEPVSIAPVAPVADDAPLASSAPRAESTSYLLAVLGGLLAVALAIWGFISIGRRKPLARRTAVKVERPATARVAEPEPRVAMPAPMVRATPVHDLRPAAPAPAASLAHTGAAVALPRTTPANFEERDALLKRMIAAKPDRANPFTTFQARRKRARLILQSLGRDFSGTQPRIDLSQYPTNWPELARSKPVAA